MRILIGGVLMAALIACSPPSGAGLAPTEGGDAAKAGTAFYTVALALPLGVPDDAGRAELAAYVDGGLAALLAAAHAGEEAHWADTNPEEPPLYQGSLFVSMAEGATAHAVSPACRQEGAALACPVALTFEDAKGKTAWSDTLVLTKGADGWRVSDIVYGGGWDTATRGRLSIVLRDVAIQGGAKLP